MRAQQRHGLQRVARRPVVDDAAGVDVVLHRGHHQPDPGFGDQPVARRDHLVEVVAGVHVHDRETAAGPGAKALSARCSITIESLPPENSSTGPLELCGHLADDVDRLGLQRPQMAELVAPRFELGRRRAHRYLLILGQVGHVYEH